ncbi:ATP synthase F1 subunit epsilon [Candidatus Peregrinibacteria bacterium]|nr:ATP synthase F1 subunit epsilon [Candidatus Peregrinibacteria bacterium]
MFDLSVITAENAIFQGKAIALSVPTVTGEVGILTGHRAMIAKLDIGGLRVTNVDKEEMTIFVAGGYLEVNNNKVTVLADTAENIEQIALEQAMEARKKAEEMLAQSTDSVSAEKLKQELRIMLMRERLANIAKYRD